MIFEKICMENKIGISREFPGIPDPDPDPENRSGSGIREGLVHRHTNKHILILNVNRERH